MVKQFLAFVLTFYVFSDASAATVNAHAAPQFNFDYSVRGTILLPYAQIEEPFTAYFDISNRRSRVDYYGDMVQTIQRGDSQKNYKVAYMTDNDGKPYRTCFLVDGDVDPQSVLPDLSGFEYKGHTLCPNTKSADNKCDLWESVSVEGDKKSTYSFFAKRAADGSAVPVAYRMMGYDSLLGSHYDEYQLNYHDYREGPQQEELFDVGNYTCRSFPGPGIKHVSLHNPIKEFVNHYGKHIDDEFEQFKRNHNKTYNNLAHHEKKKSVFRQNFRFIHSKNRVLQTFKLKINHLADLTAGEMRALRGRLYSGVKNSGQSFVAKNSSSVPDQWDWRLLGAVTPVKDQAICGSCWSFGTTGTIEGVYFVKTGHLVRLSQQQLIDCSWNQQNNGCDGGEDFRAYDYIIKSGGLSTEESYGRYLGQDGRCHDRNVTKSVKLTGYVNVTPNNPAHLRVALFKNGPVTVAIDASHKTFSFYSHGVYYEPQCGNTPEQLDHQVLAVGYGSLFGQRYWLIKNSWSTYWGNDGYVLMSEKNNNCGVMTSPTYPLME